jgi:6-phosphogluconolactonase
MLQPIILPPIELGKAVARAILTVAEVAVSLRGSFHLSLMGGRTPEHLYRALIALPNFPWNKTHLYLNDERLVPHTSTESNMVMLNQSGILGMVPKDQVHAVPILKTPEKSCVVYAKLLAACLPDGRFDCALLGAGEDGHCASLFPQFMFQDLHTSESVFPVTNSPKPPAVRITLGYEMFTQARTTIMMVCGEGKREALQSILSHPEVTPAGYILAHAVKSHLYIDSDASSSM